MARYHACINVNMVSAVKLHFPSNTSRGSPVKHNNCQQDP